MESERNKQIAILVLQGMTYDNVGIKYDISRERVREITRRILSRIEPKAVNASLRTRCYYRRDQKKFALKSFVMGRWECVAFDVEPSR